MTTNNAKTKIMKVIPASPNDFTITTTETSVSTVMLTPPKPPKQSSSTTASTDDTDDTSVSNASTNANTANNSTSYTVRSIRSKRGHNSKQHHRYQLHVSRVNMSMIIPVDPDDVITEEIPARDRIKTDELPAVHIVHMPPCYQPHHHELYVRNGDAAEFLKMNPDIRVKHYDPRDSVMTVDDDGNAITYRIGTRIIPLSEIALDKRYPCGALSRMDDNRRKGRIASSIGHNFLMESDDLPQGEITTYAKAF